MDKIKGKITLQLTNKKTGKINEVKTDNYITNLLLYNMQFCQNNSNIFTTAFTNTDFFNWSNGIVLLKDVQPVNNKYFINSSDTVIGYANKEVYSGEDVLRGSFNELESGYLSPTKLRMVWDFGTNIGIGTIRAVSRVHHSHLPYSYYGDNSLKAINPTGGKGAVGLYEGSSGNYYSAVSASRDFVLIDYNNWESVIDWDNLYISKLAHNNVFTNRLNNSLRPDGSLYKIKFELTEDTPTGFIEGVETNYSRSTLPIIDKEYLYILYYLNGVGFKIHKYSLSTGLFVTEETYNFAFSASPSRFNVTGNEIIYSNGSNLYIVDKSSLTEAEIAVDFDISCIAVNQNNDNKLLVVNDTTGNVNSFVIVEISSETVIDGGTIEKSPKSTYHGGYTRRYFSYFDTFQGIDFVYVERKAYGTRYSSRWLDIYTGGGFLAEGSPLITISNLSSPVTKGADQALKIIYDFEW